MSSSSASAVQRPGPGPVFAAERLRGSLKDSAVARLLLKGRLTEKAAMVKGPPVTPSVPVDGRVHSPPPPMDLSMTNRSAKLLTVNNPTFSLTAVASIERLKYVLSCEMHSLLSRLGRPPSTVPSATGAPEEEGRTVYACRLCPYVVSQVIELLAHYRSHSDSLAHLGQKCPEVLTDWFEFYLKTSTLRSIASTTIAPVDHRSGSGSPTRCSCPGQSSRFDLRDLLLKPLRTSCVSDDRSLTLYRQRASSESHLLRGVGCNKAADDLSRSSTPYTMISALTDDENVQQTTCAAKRITNGRQGATCYDDDVTSAVKCEANDASPVRSLQSCPSEKEKDGSGRRSQDDASSEPDVTSRYPGPFQNGRWGEDEGRRSADRSPPTLKREVDEPRYEDDGCHDHVTDCRKFDCHGPQSVQMNCVRDGPYWIRDSLAKLGCAGHFLHPGLRSVEVSNPDHAASRTDISPECNGSRSNEDRPSTYCDVIDSAAEAGRQCRSPDDGETVPLRYAYKQYKRLRKNNAPRSLRPDQWGLTLTGRARDEASVEDPDVAQGVQGPPVGGEGRPSNSDIGIQCDLLASPWSSRTEVGWKEEEEEKEEEEVVQVGRTEEERCLRKRPFPVDDEDDLTAPDAVCLQRRCNPCGITFDDDVIFSIHMGCHSHAHPFLCNICGRHCDNKYAFNTHVLRGHHPT